MTHARQPIPACVPLGEAALLVHFRNRISPAVNDQVHRLLRSIQACRQTGISDLVPAYASLLVRFDPDTTSHSQLRQLIARVVAQEGATPPEGQQPREHIVPVQYGGDAGPDLEDVALARGLSIMEVVRLHSQRSYRVYFLGFLPGFAYLGKLPCALEASRLATPRTRLPGGSVAVAGAQTAVYPCSSPGGWRLIGRTALQVWDPSRKSPARFQPGDTVRFVRSDYEQPIPDPSPVIVRAQLPALRILDASGHTTVQDLGRLGLGHLGVAQGGAFDAAAAVRANALLGNDPGAAVLEMTWSGPTMEVLHNLTLALDGAELQCKIDGASIPPRLSWFVRRGSTIRFSPRSSGQGGVRGYMAVAGGVDVPVVLGARSTSLQAHFGGYMGRALSAGDVLGLCAGPPDPSLLSGRYWPGMVTPPHVGDVTLRFVAYRARGEALRAARHSFARTAFILTEHADRMGFRFRSETGESLPNSPGELLSFGVVRGAVQLPHDGNPVVLNVDHQTTGGYPLLGVVIQADWPVLAQLAPGTRVRFVEVSMEEAYAERREALRRLQEGLCTLRPRG